MEGRVTLAVVALPAEANLAETYPTLPALAPDGVHARGTFERADRVISLQPQGLPIFLNLPVGQATPLSGYDALSGGPAVNRGHYGVVYRLEVKPSSRDVVVLLNPRGGGVAGAAKVAEFLVPLPRAGFGLQPTEVIKAGLVSAGQEATVLFMPPGGASLPLRPLFWPLR